MRQVNIRRVDGGYDRVSALEVSEFPFFVLPEGTRRAKNKKVTYMNTFAVFDIEATTIHPDPDEAPEGFMYHWQMNIGGVIVYGRRWEEWFELMEMISDWLNLSEYKRMVCYVFNLGYEFQFIKDFMIERWGRLDVFAAKRRAPIYVLTERGFEFRCAQKLTNMSLYAATKNELGVEHPKAKGDLDYDILRTADTPLTDIEFGYCISDVVSLYELIEHRLINEDDKLDTIPLTSTGYVRRDARRNCRADRRYRRSVFLRQKMSKDVYILLKEAGRGGNTHANRFMSGQIWEGIDGVDAASMYPAMQILFKFPMDKFSYYGNVDDFEEFEKLLSEYACLFRVILTNVNINKNVQIPYIASAKLTGHGAESKYDNGRLLRSTWISLTVTDIDWKIITEQYTYDEISVSDFYIAAYGYLPDPIIKTVMDYFKLKTEFKAAIEKEKDPEEKKNLQYLYNRSKEKLNAVFGMSYTDPVRPELIVNEEGQWEDPKIQDIDAALEKFYKSRNSFMVYAWGVWTTCYARAHLQKILNITGENTLYCDTDSDKAIIDAPTMKRIEALNNDIIKLCEERGAYADVEGRRYYMGVFELETAKEKYKRFCTLGAKKYCYEDSEGFHITIAGVEKETGAKEMGCIENFKPGFIFKKAGGRTLYYNEAKPHYIEVAGCRMLTASNIGMIGSTYELGLTDEYASLLGLNVYRDIR